MRTNWIIVFGTLAVTYSCKPKETTTEWNSGDANVATYVAIGGSSTGGYMHDALTNEGQQNSLAAILSAQFEMAGGSSMVHPSVSSSSIGWSLTGASVLELGFKTDCNGTTSLSPVRVGSSGDVSVLNNVYSSTNRNFGIPFLSSLKLNDASYGDPMNGTHNPFFARMASSTSSSILSDLSATNMTFCSVQVGIDEVLDYARKGASSGSLAPVNGPAGTGFSGSVQELMDLVESKGAKAVVATIPDVMTMPYFTTIPYDGLDLDAESAESLNQIYNPIGINFVVGKNAFMIEDPNAGVFGVRQMVPGELLLLNVPLDSVKCHKMGSVFPLRDEFILTLDEQQEIRTAVEGYNESLVNMANSKGFAVVREDYFYKSISTGIVYNGVSLNAQFVSGGAYSLDGLRLNPRGNALLANEYIRAINQKYNARIPYADPIKYKGIVFP
ncbi:MAG: hypothetical protein EP305_13475 [Bacteroidetes bacterium]|nr:MAG: hypothetical protein EP305_13475 [Bacteroidota bacterium]